MPSLAVRLTLLLLTLTAIPAAAQQARWWSPVVARQAMVVSANREATEAGVDIMRRGGTAVDAAIAVHFALAVTLPNAGNLGGGGFLVLRQADGTVKTYDYRERAPLAATSDMYLDANGAVIEDLSLIGGKAAGIPGSVAGMALVHARHATLPWAELIAPAIRLAEAGFPINLTLAGNIASYQSSLSRFPASAAIFLPGGSPPVMGDTLRQTALARSLRLIAEQGPDVFYRGELADSLVAGANRYGGIFTREDFAAYEAHERPPVTFDYRGWTIHSMGPASSGGLTMKLILEQLETFDLAAYPFHSAAAVHRITEAMRRAFAVRNAHFGDTDFITLPDTLRTEGFARLLAATIDTLRATPSAALPSGFTDGHEGIHTTHFSVVDPQGNAVASTTTLNDLFGSRVSAAGILLNDEMDDFTVKPGVPNTYGLVQGEANRIEPGKRPLSAMTPTIVERGGLLRFVVGTPGGSTIISTVAQVLINALDYDMTIAEAIDARRLHHQHLPDVLRVEPFGLSDDTVQILKAQGHTVEFRDEYSGRVNGIEVGPETGWRYGRSDLRGGGWAAGY
ncbi:MAG: gamma-glutamyltransferase [Gemmatimonadota bacterium]